MSLWGKRAIVSAPIQLVLALLVACSSGGTPESPSPVPGVTSLCQPLAQAERYRYSFAYSLDSPQPEGDVDDTVVGDPPFALQPTTTDFELAQEYEGAIENPNKVDITVKTEGGEDLRLLYIGGDQWAYLGGSWIPRQPEPVPFAPLDMCNAVLSDLDLTDISPASETIDGIKALRYEVGDVELDTSVQIWGQQSDMGRLLKTLTVVVWLSEEGNVPVRVESKAVGTYPGGRKLTMELTLEVSDINAGDIKVEPPSS